MEGSGLHSPVVRGSVGAAKLPALVALLLVVVGGLAAWPFTVDDAYIILRYGQRLASGLGYSFNDGQISDGVTGPAWVLPVAVASWLGQDPLPVVKGLGLGCVALATWRVVVAAGTESSASATGWCVALLLAAQIGLAIWAVAGLETGAATLACSGVVLSALGPSNGAGQRCGGWVTLAAWLRPELAVLAAVAIVLLWARAPGEGRRALAWASAGAAALVCWRLWMFGDWLPLSYHAKPALLDNGFEYVLRGWEHVAGPIGLLGVVLAGWLGGFRERALVGLLCAHVLACVLAGGDWMPGPRLLAPVLPVYAWIVGGVCASLLKRGPWRWLGLGLMLVCVVWPAIWGLRELPGVREAGRVRDRQTAELVRIVMARPGPIAALDVGALGYLSGLPLLDLGGLTDPAVARARGEHLAKRVPEALLRARGIQWLLLHSVRPPGVTEDGRLRGLAGYGVERRVARMGWVQSQFRVVRTWEYSPGYFYVLLRRTVEVAVNQHGPGGREPAHSTLLGVQRY